jgi:hypothetical protein
LQLYQSLTMLLVSFCYHQSLQSPSLDSSANSPIAKIKLDPSALTHADDTKNHNNITQDRAFCDKVTQLEILNKLIEKNKWRLDSIYEEILPADINSISADILVFYDLSAYTSFTNNYIKLLKDLLGAGKVICFVTEKLFINAKHSVDYRKFIDALSSYIPYTKRHVLYGFKKINDHTIKFDITKKPIIKFILQCVSKEIIMSLFGHCAARAGLKDDICDLLKTYNLIRRDDDIKVKCCLVAELMNKTPVRYDNNSGGPWTEEHIKEIYSSYLDNDLDNAYYTENTETDESDTNMSQLGRHKILSGDWQEDEY